MPGTPAARGATPACPTISPFSRNAFRHGVRWSAACETGPGRCGWTPHQAGTVGEGSYLCGPARPSTTAFAVLLPPGFPLVLPFGPPLPLPFPGPLPFPCAFEVDASVTSVTSSSSTTVAAAARRAFVSSVLFGWLQQRSFSVWLPALGHSTNRTPRTWRSSPSRWVSNIQVENFV